MKHIKFSALSLRKHLMLRLAKSLQFFQQSDDLHSQAQAFIAPQGYSLIVGSNNQNIVPIYGPGSSFQGQVILQLAKPIKGPCRLRVAFTCQQNLGPYPLASSSTNSPTSYPHEELTSVTANPPSPNSPSSIPTTSASHSHIGATIIRPFSSASTGSRRNSRSLDSTCSSVAGEHHVMLFDIEHVLFEDQYMAVKRHLFMFTIKLPMCNFPPSFQEKDRFVVYTVHSDLTFMTQPEDPATRVTLQASPVQIKYVPMVPSSIVQFPVIEMGQGLEPTTNKPLYKVTVESEQRGASPGESIPFRLTLSNTSPTELYSIQIALVRTMTFYPEYAGRAAAASNSTTASAPISQYSPESTIVDSTTIPVSTSPNKGLTWSENIQYTIPKDSNLIPTTNKTVTSLFKVDYYIAISVPIASKSAGLGSWFTQGFKAPPPINLSQIPVSTTPSPSPPSTATTGTTQQEPFVVSTTVSSAHRRSQSENHRLSKVTLQSITSDRVASINTSGKWPTLIQLPLVPIIVGTVPSTISERRLRWPIPSYQEVTAQPCFIRDKFEEEMHKQLEQMESLMMEEDDIDVEDLVKAAQQHKADSSGSDEDEGGGKHGHHHRRADRVPARFRSGMGLKTPPPSPPSSSPPLDNLMGAVASMRSGSSNAGLAHTLPRSAGRPPRSMSPKAGGGGGLSKGVLLEMHHKAQQQQYASMT
ncbi:hypothetical protein BGW41_000164 [Actinomortierella wolfii]|nr:hypothetical protein BGW41_000164 [Actinomortierella wolfii]